MKRPSLVRHLMLERETTTPDQSGGFTTTWQVMGAHWADIKASSGGETRGQGTPVSRVGYKIIVRAAPPSSDARPVAGQRFRGHGRIYAIQAVTEYDAKGRYLICTAIEETAT